MVLLFLLCPQLNIIPNVVRSLFVYLGPNLQNFLRIFVNLRKIFLSSSEVNKLRFRKFFFVRISYVNS